MLKFKENAIRCRMKKTSIATHRSFVTVIEQAFDKESMTVVHLSDTS